MRKLAQELGTGAASLYWHVGDKEQLLGLLLDRIVGENKVPEPDPANWRDQVKELGRNTRRLFAQHRDSAQLSLGRVPIRPELAAGARTHARGDGVEQDPVAAHRAGGRHVRALRRRVRLRGEPAERADQPAAVRRVPASRCRRSSSPRSPPWPTSSSPAAPTSASSSRSNCSSAAWRRWRYVSVAVRTASDVGVVEPPGGSVLTITPLDAVEVTGDRGGRGAVAARREQRRRRLGRLTRPREPDHVGLAAGRRRQVVGHERRLVAVDLELGRGLLAATGRP